MKITFDPAKDEKTRIERGFSLALGVEVIRNQVTLKLDAATTAKIGWFPLVT